MPERNKINKLERESKSITKSGIALAVILAASLWGCAPYQQQATPYKSFQLMTPAEKEEHNKEYREWQTRLQKEYGGHKTPEKMKKDAEFFYKLAHPKLRDGEWYDRYNKLIKNPQNKKILDSYEELEKDKEKAEENFIPGLGGLVDALKKLKEGKSLR